MRAFRFVKPLPAGSQLGLLAALLTAVAASGMGVANARWPTLDTLAVTGCVMLTGCFASWALADARRHGPKVRDTLAAVLTQANDLVTCSFDLVWDVDATGRFTSISDLRGLSRDVPALRVGASLADLAALKDTTRHEPCERQHDAFHEGKAFRDLHLALPRAAGGLLHLSINGIPLRDPRGVRLGFRGFARDCTAEVEARHALERISRTDLLTGLANRHEMRRWLTAVGIISGEQAKPDFRPPPFAYFLIDLDGFKFVNDTHGHAAGDALLKTVASRLQDVAGPRALCARIGVDEFAVIVEGLGATEAAALGQRFVEALAAPFAPAEAVTIRPGASIGISVCPDHGADAQALFRRADRALYMIKRRGGQGALLFDPVLNGAGEPERTLVGGNAPARSAGRDRTEAALEQALRAAAQNDEFHVVFQPVAVAEDATVFAFEALLRWTSPTLGAVPPTTFIPVAESCGLILDLGAFVLREACRLAADAGGDWAVTVNVSAVQFCQPGLVTDVLDVLSSTGLSPSRLILELTEQSLLCEQDDVRARMRALRSAGVRIALDDFGSGFSNVSYLKDFKFDVVKIDRTVLLLPDHQRGRVLGALLEICRSFEALCVVEGIESMADWNLAQTLGATFLQGYHIARPQRGFAYRTPMSQPAAVTPPHPMAKAS